MSNDSISRSGQEASVAFVAWALAPAEVQVDLQHPDGAVTLTLSADQADDWAAKLLDAAAAARAHAAAAQQLPFFWVPQGQR